MSVVVSANISTKSVSTFFSGDICVCVCGKEKKKEKFRTGDKDKKMGRVSLLERHGGEREREYGSEILGEYQTKLDPFYLLH